MGRVVRGLVALAMLAVGAWPVPALPVASAQSAQVVPPEPGAVVVEDAQAAPGGYGAYTCPSGRGRRELANGGNTITINGGCQAAEAYPGSGIDVRGLEIADGEVSVDVRQLSGGDRLLVQVMVRTHQDGGFSGYVVSLSPAKSTAILGVSVQGSFTTLGRNADLGGILSPDGWNTLTVRVQGTSLWVFVNNQLAIEASDPSFDAGEVMVLIARDGPLDPADSHEVAGVLRNLRVSALAGGDQARAPSYLPPHVVQTATDVPCTAPTGLARDVALVLPGPGLDAKIAALAGAWEGTWDEASPNPLASRLYVERIDASKATILYTWGEAPGINTRAGWQRTTADIQPDGKLAFGAPSRRFSFWASGENTLDGTLETPQFTSRITLSRCPAR